MAKPATTATSAIALNTRNAHYQAAIKIMVDGSVDSNSVDFNACRELAFAYADGALPTDDSSCIVTFLQDVHAAKIAARRKAKFAIDVPETITPSKSDVSRMYNVAKLGQWKHTVKGIFDSLKPLNPSKTAMVDVAARFTCTSPFTKKAGYSDPPMARDASKCTITTDMMREYIKFGSDARNSKGKATRTDKSRVESFKKWLESINKSGDAHLAQAISSLTLWIAAQNKLAAERELAEKMAATSNVTPIAGRRKRAA